MIIALASQFHIYLPCLGTRLVLCLNSHSVLNVKFAAPLSILVSLAEQCLLRIKHKFPDNLEVSQRSQTAEETDTLSLCWIKIYPCYIW